jgi:hypothetical protein
MKERRMLLNETKSAVMIIMIMQRLLRLGRVIMNGDVKRSIV